MRLPFDVRFLVLGMLVYVVVLVLNFPAERAYAYLKHSENAGQFFSLAGISGSAWSGKADLARINGAQLENLEWSLRPWSLLLGQVGINLRAQIPSTEGGPGFGHGDITLGLGGSVELSDVEAKLPAAMMAGMAKMAALRPSGSFNLNLNNLEWDGQNLVSAVGRIVWADAGVSLLKPLALGDLSVNLETADDKIKGVISDGGGPLSIDGLVTLNSEGSYQFNGSLAARANPSGDNSLANALSSLGRPGADGKIKVNQSGTLASLGLVPKQPKR